MDNKIGGKKLSTTELSKLSFFQSLFYSKFDLLKLLGLIVYIILTIYLYTKNPNSLVTNFPDFFLVATAVITFVMFYININNNETEINFKFDIFKYIILILCYMTELTFVLAYNPTGFITKNFMLPIIFLLFFPAFLLLGFLMFYFRPVVGNVAGDIRKDRSAFIKIITYFLGISFLAIFVAFSFHYFVGLIANLTSSFGIVKFVINIFIIFILLILIFKAITYTNLYRDNPLVQLILDSIFYIPCLIISPMNYLNEEWKKVTFMDFVFLAIAILLFVLYYLYPKVSNHYAKQGGTLLLNKPIDTNIETTLASYIELNGTENYDYHFGLCFWLYLDNASPSVTQNSTKYVSVFNYGDKPNILYNVAENKLMFTMLNTFPEEEIKYRGLELDEYGNIILYTIKDVLLERWSNYIINYNGGTLDIFCNGELLKSFPQIIPYMNYDSLTVGTKKGVIGGICSVLYFKEKLTMNQITHLYNHVKDKNPPLYSSKDTKIIPLKK
jgi:hypothetical protein